MSGLTFYDIICIPIVIIVFRETLEAAVLVAVLIQYLQRRGEKQLIRDVWMGAALGTGISFCMAAIILSIYYTQTEKLGGSTESLVEGTMLGVAAICIAYFLVTHLAPGMKQKGTWQTKWEKNLEAMIQNSATQRYGFFFLSFSSVIREGFETCVFIVGIGASCEPTALPGSVLAGVLIGVACGAIMFRGSKSLDLSAFFKVSAAFLALIAAGLAAHASYEYQKGEFFGTWSCQRKCETVFLSLDDDFAAATSGYTAIASYVPISDVTVHAAIDLDVAAMDEALDAAEWDTAWSSYADGGNSVKSYDSAGTPTYRTVRGFSTDLSGEATYDEYYAYHGNALYADDYIRAALWDRVADSSSAKTDARPDLWSDISLTDVMAYQLAYKGAQYQNTWIYSTHELYSALEKCNDGNVDDDSGAPHAWDEGWAFYAGSLAGEDGKDSGVLSYALADKRCSNFGTCVDNLPLPSWRDTDDGANSNVNAKLLRLYRAGQRAMRDETRCDEGESYVERIVAQMTVPLVQGTLRYAWRSDPHGNNETLGSDGKAFAEFNAFATALVPRLYACDTDAADVLTRNMMIPASLADDASIVPDGFAAVKSAIESTYSCLGIVCADVGGLLDGDAYVTGMEPCDDGSTVDDDAVYYDNLEAIAEGARPAIASYVPVSDVTEHAAIDEDVAAMEGALKAYDWDVAWSAYADGGNSVKSTDAAGTPTYRTVRGFSTDLGGEATYDEYYAYHGNALYADDYIRAALWDRLSDTSSAKTDGRPDLWSDITLTDVMAYQLAYKGAQYQNTWIYSTHELYSALEKCNDGNVDDASGAPHAWDEGWAFYAGSLAGIDGKASGVLTYALADKRCSNFGTCVDDEPLPSWRTSDDGANSNANAKLLRLYRAGLQAMRDATRCNEGREYVERIVAQMTVPLVQGTLRYAWRSDPNGNNETLSSDGKALAEFNAFAMALVPRIYACDTDAADVLTRNMIIPASLSDFASTVPDGYAAVKSAIESTYSCLTISCSDVGGLLDGDSYVSGMEPCSDGSSVDDDAEYYDDLEAIAGESLVEEECEEDDDDGWHSYRRQLRTSRMNSCDDKGQSIAWVNHEVYDIESCCDTDNWFFFLLMTLFWYRPSPSRLEVITWFAFWVITFVWGYYKVMSIKEHNKELEAESDKLVHADVEKYSQDKLDKASANEGKEDVAVEVNEVDNA
ncbi:hypothetical protein CTAYLR_008535 [Chrysophaeum taylorii]|uniref:Iron permease FTR1 n=1 Tax=Chrysophaeum taylorii TaxID=2483200 RepID=A0AAD7U7P9_9STRA|nr:hypothetical protein CTAYLR_008535 [Chrysophaeum taylorii]